MSTQRIELKRWSDFTDHDREQLAALRGQIDFQTPPYSWTSMDDTPWRILTWDGDRLVNHVSVIERDIQVGEQIVPVAGIRSVMTLPSERGKGHASRGMERAAEFITADLPRAEHGLLLCIDIRIPLYERLGWRRVTEQTVFEQPSGQVVGEVNTMVRPFRGRPWPDGRVDLRGLPW
jgi:hypothetical protein